MSYLDQQAKRNVTSAVMDVETGIRDREAVEPFIGPVYPAKNLKNSELIQADIEKKVAERDAKLGLDYNLGNIVALGYWTDQTGTICRPCRTDHEEAAALTEFWELTRHRSIVGFNCRNFDLRYCIQRSRFLNIARPVLDLGRYGKGSIVDLYAELTFNDPFSDGAMKRSLKSFCRRFGIAVDDDVDGSDIQALVDAGDYDAITWHCISDIELTKQLAQRLGYISEATTLTAADAMTVGLVL